MSQPDNAHRRSLLDERCARHQFEAAIDRCRQCGHPFCGECLVYSFGDSQPPFCIPCALAAAGVRSNAARPPALGKKELRRRQKAEARIAEEAAARATAAPSPIDWSLPITGNGSSSGTNGSSPFPDFDDEQPTARPQAPTPPPSSGKSRGGLFGRKKNKTVPF